MKAKTLIITTIGVFLLIQPISAQTWLFTQRLTWTSMNSWVPAIATGSGNNIHVVWSDRTPGNSEIYYKKSTNGGITWGVKRLTWNQRTSGDPNIAVDSSNRIHMVWIDNRPDNNEIFYMKSIDEGVTWGGAKRLTYNSGASWRPTIAVDSSNNIHVVWYDGTPGNDEIYYKRSTNGGVAWGGVHRLTWNSEGSAHPAIATDSWNSIHVVWHDYTPGNLEIYYRKGGQ